MADNVSRKKFNEVIAEGEAILERIDQKRKRVQGAIETFKEMRDAGEPWDQSIPSFSATHN